MTEKQLIMSFIMTFLVSLTALYFIATIVTTMKNKAKKVTRKQITHKTTKIDLCRNLVANIPEDYLGQRKMIFNELVRM